MTADCLNAYPDYNKPFKIYTDASDYQLGAAIIQEGRPIAYWSRSLQSNQMKYTTTEKELLAIILCLKEYERILYGAKIEIYTDHKNLTFKTLSIKRILRWRTYIDQYDVDLKYIPGKDNILADCFSRLPRIDKQVKNPEPSILGRGRPSSPQSVMNFPESFDRADATDNRDRKRKRESPGTFVDFKKLESPSDDFEIDGEAFLSLHDDNEVIKCLFPDNVDPIETVLDLPYIPRESFLNLPHRSLMENPLEMNNIEQHQIHCQELQRLRTVNPTMYPTKLINGRQLIVHQERNQERWRICLPTSLVHQVVKWYHFTLGHCGTEKLYDTILNRFYYYPKIGRAHV